MKILIENKIEGEKREDLGKGKEREGNRILAIRKKEGRQCVLSGDKEKGCK